MKRKIVGWIASGLLVLAVVVPGLVLFSGRSKPGATSSGSLKAPETSAQAAMLAKTASTSADPQSKTESMETGAQLQTAAATPNRVAPTSKSRIEPVHGARALAVLAGRDGRARIAFQSIEALVALQTERRITIGFELEPLREGGSPRRFLVASPEVGSTEISRARFESWVAGGAIFDLGTDAAIGSALRVGAGSSGFFLVMDDALAATLMRAADVPRGPSDVVLEIDAMGLVRALEG